MPPYYRSYGEVDDSSWIFIAERLWGIQLDRVADLGHFHIWMSVTSERTRFSTMALPGWGAHADLYSPRFACGFAVAMLIYVCISYGDQRVIWNQFEIIINVLVNSFLLLWMALPMFTTIIICLLLLVRGSSLTVRRDVKFWRLKTVAALKGLITIIIWDNLTNKRYHNCNDKHDCVD